MIPPRTVFHRNPQGNWWFNSVALSLELAKLSEEERQVMIHRAQTWVARVNNLPQVRHFSENES